MLNKSKSRTNNEPVSSRDIAIEWAKNWSEECVNVHRLTLTYKSKSKPIFRQSGCGHKDLVGKWLDNKHKKVLCGTHVYTLSVRSVLPYVYYYDREDLVIKYNVKEYSCDKNFKHLLQAIHC